MSSKIVFSCFSLERKAYGGYRVSYLKPHTNIMYVWFMTDSLLIDKTFNSESCRVGDWLELRRKILRYGVKHDIRK